MISAITTFADETAALAASTEVPSEQKPWASGYDSCTTATSRGTWRDSNSHGMSERKIGTNSARPSSMAWRTFAPAKRE
ncbi:hypothetical protein D3C87_1760820 [compost metagenome]